MHSTGSEISTRTPPAVLLTDSAERIVVPRALGATAQMAPPQPPMREPWLITFTPPEERGVELTPLAPLTTVVWKGAAST